jgi:hypothetical protein
MSQIESATNNNFKPVALHLIFILSLSHFHSQSNFLYISLNSAEDDSCAYVCFWSIFNFLNIHALHSKENIYKLHSSLFLDNFSYFSLSFFAVIIIYMKNFIYAGKNLFLRFNLSHII